MNDARRLEVLRAIVQDYVETSEPVGSKALLERHQLGVSAATVRGDMAALEEQGLIMAPHTSAGRVPTDAGYRTFVDQLSQMKPLSRAERAAIEHFLADAVDLDDVVDRTVRMLAGLTNQVAVMQYPSFTAARVRHVELVEVAPQTVLVVVILTSGRVEQRVITLDVDAATLEAHLATARGRINSVVSGLTRAEGTVALAGMPIAESAPPAGYTVAPTARPVAADDELTRQVAAAVGAILGEEREDRVVLAGTSYLARHLTDFPTSIGPILEALEEHVVLLKLFDRMRSEGGPEVTVRIGAENTDAGLQSTSLVASTYAVGGLGVLGPTRMDYPTTIAAVRAVAHYVSDILNQ